MTWIGYVSAIDSSSAQIPLAERCYSSVIDIDNRLIWGMHPKFGEQFKLAFYKELMPATAYAIEKYLGSGLIKGIGPVMA